MTVCCSKGTACIKFQQPTPRVQDLEDMANACLEGGHEKGKPEGGNEMRRLCCKKNQKWRNFSERGFVARMGAPRSCLEIPISGYQFLIHFGPRQWNLERDILIWFTTVVFMLILELTIFKTPTSSGWGSSQNRSLGKQSCSLLIHEKEGWKKARSNHMA